MPRLTAEQRNQAVGMLINTSVSNVARFFNTSRKTIRQLNNRFITTGSVKDRPRSGQPRKTTHADDRRIRTLHLRDRFRTASYTARNSHVPISRHTIRRRLKTYGIICRRAAKRLNLKPEHIQARLNWTLHYRRWVLRQWEQVIFSDESRFVLERHDGRQRVYRRVGERFLNTTVQTASDKRGIMVWGAISVTGKSQLVVIQGNLTANRYIEICLRQQLIPFYNQHNQQMLFQHDNARPHTANMTRNFLTQNNINTLPWPALSPDLNPIEQLWDRIDRDIRNQVRKPRTIQELTNAVQNAWNAVHQMDIRRLVLSMRRRCTAVQNAGGVHTRY